MSDTQWLPTTDAAKALGFPSPCGELRVSDAKSPPVVDGGAAGLRFPSPCGELRVSDILRMNISTHSLKGFRPLAGN